MLPRLRRFSTCCHRRRRYMDRDRTKISSSNVGQTHSSNPHPDHNSSKYPLVSVNKANNEEIVSASLKKTKKFSRLTFRGFHLYFIKIIIIIE